MKFPIQYCVDIRGMHPQIFNKLLTKMKQDGYHLPSNCYDIFTEWNYVGVNSYSDISFYNNPLHYIDLDVEPFYNVLGDEWLEQLNEEIKI